MPHARFALLHLLWMGLCLGAGAAERVRCHVDYGGQTQVVEATPLAHPQAAYDVAPQAIGSYFLFRIVFQRQPAAQAHISLYTYADREDRPVPLHQARFPYPPPRGGREGFTGRQWVYEPVRDGELSYWCEWLGGAAR